MGEMVVQVAYPFGHGLSYTTFEYSWDPANGPPVATSEGGAQIRVQVQNTGITGGVEVVQVYATFPESDGFSTSTKALKRYKRVQLNAGETAVLNLDLTADSFRRWSNEAWAFETPCPGAYHVSVGSSSRDIRLDADLDIQVEA
jgi:beta-glucosidase